MTTIDLRREGDYRRETYGVLLTSKTHHEVTGKGVHNRHHDHTLDVWENRLEFTDGREKCYLAPDGEATARRYSFLLSPHANVISATPIPSATTEGDTLEMGSVVRVTIEGFPIGWFQIMAKPLHNPHLIPVDVATSASRQFYIDSGEYIERDLDD